MFKITLKPALAAIALSACGGSEVDPTATQFATPNAAGALFVADTTARSGSDFSAVTGNGYGYQLGEETSEGFIGAAGIVPGATVSAPPTSGTAVMTGTFEVGVLEGIVVNGSQVSGQSFIDSGAITLTADFDANTLTGSGTGVDAGLLNFFLRNNVLSIDGQMSGTELTGTATYNGTSGPLRGLVGGNEAIGVFHGNTDTDLHAGGFIVN